ncbi:peptidoglycan/LPS O-acetylase OafA/YrhL [Roseiarcus fermentans]|uniref:Peptidoglycan/LPS O-acetylase OafA/YrhL n=1 Tax=Roseiarcus fermentans TaxID=1473586 RepID=A0A366FBS4_9HYPH|nr:acyltransferase family protein [Roseiarcus fermentans]RBP11209.1 peptidoglycan/LPS O-acetylase OafA/YrhL [Roseiarcus fermentans]
MKPEPEAVRLGERLDYVDALRVILILLVIAHHSVEPYVVTHPPEMPLPGPPIPRAWVFLWVNAAFFMGLFFFLAGYFTPEAFASKGGSAFLRDRWRRLGRPLLFGWIVLAPLPGWAQITFGPAALHVDYWTYLTRDFFGFGQRPADWPAGMAWPVNNLGHLWFLEHLLVYATLYAGLRAAFADRGEKRLLEPPSHRMIAAYAVALAAATFVVRIWFPQNRWIGFLGYIQMEPAHLPQYASLFVIGALAAPRRWIETIPTPRGLVWLALGVGLALAAYVAVGAGVVPDLPSQDWRVCVWESFLCVGLCVGLPVLLRELALGKGRTWRMLAANVYAVYVFHFPIVLFFLWALMDAPGPKWARLLMTVIGATVASFAFTNWVILRLPLARRVF